MEYMDQNMVKDRDKNSGRYTASVGDDEIVNYVRERGGVTTTDVADEFDYERPSAYRRLKALEGDDRIESRKIGNSLLWEVPRDERERHETPSEPTSDVSPTDAPVTGEADGSDPERERARKRLRELDDTLEGDESVFEIRLDAVLAIFEHLRDTDGKKRKGDLEDYVDDAGIDTGYASFGSLWSNWVKADSGKGRPNLLTELPGVERRGNYYTYTGGDDGDGTRE